VSRDTDPVPALACTAARLTSPPRRVHRAVLAGFTATGQPPPAAEIERLIRASGGDPGRGPS
jgi:hypothetical protein